MPAYIKKCPECGGINLLLNKEKGEVICRDCGLVIEEKLIDFGQEWREFDSDQSEKKRRTGAPMTYSVSKSEPILVRQNGEIRIRQIGEFVDTLINKNKENLKSNGFAEFMSVKEQTEVLSFDKHYAIDFRKVTEVSRHPTGYIYQIDLEYGKRVCVTGSHSVFTVLEDKVIPVRVDNLREGILLLLPKEFLLLPNLRKLRY